MLSSLTFLTAGEGDNHGMLPLFLVASVWPLPQNESVSIILSTRGWIMATAIAIARFMAKVKVPLLARRWQTVGWRIIG